jgi:hypothetical protein
MRICSTASDAASGKGLQGRQILLNNVPDNIDLDRMICVPQHIAEIDHFLPIDGRIIFLDFVRKSSRCFADDFQKPFGCHSQYDIGSELLQAPALSRILNRRDRFKDIVQPVLDGRRHSEYLGQVVGNPFGHPRF